MRRLISQPCVEAVRVGPVLVSRQLGERRAVSATMLMRPREHGGPAAIAPSSLGNPNRLDLDPGDRAAGQSGDESQLHRPDNASVPISDRGQELVWVIVDSANRSDVGLHVLGFPDATERVVGQERDQGGYILQPCTITRELLGPELARLGAFRLVVYPHVPRSHTRM